jgi:mRNA-degrading endonuclease toxin of MazEF toxin-antitoxin module
VLSPSAYNRRANLALVCPTTRDKGYPFEVAFPSGLPLSGVVLADHLKSAYWAAAAHSLPRRFQQRRCELTAKLRPLLGL